MIFSIWRTDDKQLHSAVKSSQGKAKTAFSKQPRVKRRTICRGQRVLIFCPKIRSFSTRLLTPPILSRQRETGCQKIGTFGELAAKGNQDILSFIPETEKVLKLLWPSLVITTFVLHVLQIRKESTSTVPECSMLYIFICSAWPSSFSKRAPWQMRVWHRRGRHAVQICPKYSRFWNFAYYHSPGQDGIGVGRNRNNELPLELICFP